MAATDIWTEAQAGPASYSTGGFVVTTTLSTVASFQATVATGHANLEAALFVYALNTPAAGQVTVKVMQETFQKLTIGAVSGLPAGVTAQGTSGQQVATETPHSHAADHDHAVTAASGTMTGGSGLVTQAAVGAINTSTHTHTANLANLVVASGTQTHQHTWDHIYQHGHGVTNTATDVSLVELANATDISGVTFNLIGASQ